MSRSCHKATSWSPASRFERTTRASPLIVSAEIGLRLWGIADEPFWPGLNPSSTSPTSVRWRWRSSTAIISHVAAVDAHAHSSSAWRSRAITWVAGTGRSPRRLGDVAARRTGRRSSRCRPRPTACTPTPPRSARRRRSRSRWSCSAHSATLAPNVVGSAWMPCVRPIITVARCRSASAVDGGDQRVDRVEQRAGRRRAWPGTAPCRRRRTTSGRSGSTTRPARRCAACTTSTNAATSWSVMRSRSATCFDERARRPRRPLPAGGGVGGRDDAERGVGLGGQQLDLEPPPEPGRCRPTPRPSPASV